MSLDEHNTPGNARPFESAAPIAAPSPRGRFGVGLAIALAALGMAICGVLLQHHLVIEVGGDPMLSGVCEMSEKTSCDAVLRSEWSRFRSLPTALWGYFYFASVLAWYAAVGRPAPAQRRWHVVPLVMTAAGAGIAAGLAYVMYTRMPAICPLCAATHGLALLLFIVTALLWPRRGRPRQASDEEHTSQVIYAARPIGGALLVFVLLGASLCLAGSGEYYRRLHRAAAIDFKARWQVYESDLQMVYNRYQSEPKVDIPVGPNDSIRGDRNARHTIVVFADLQCDFCRSVDKVLRDRVAASGGAYRLVFKHFPMNSECNSQVNSKTHPGACAAAVTAEAARRVGGEEAFWKMHDELFSHQASFARKASEFVRQACERSGIDHAQLWSNIQTTSIWSRISEHVAQAKLAHVTATPAVFLDGRRVHAWSLLKFWDYVLVLDTPPNAPRSRPAAGSAPSAK